MSTYLVAFVVGEFDVISAYSKNGIQVNWWRLIPATRPSERASGATSRWRSVFTRLPSTPFVFRWTLTR